MDLSISGHAFNDFEPRELVTTLTERFEIFALDYWPQNSGSLPISEFGRMLAQARVRVVAVNVPASRPRLMDPLHGAEAVREIEAAIENAVELGASRVCIYPAIIPGATTSSSVLRLANELAPLLDMAQRNGVSLLLENNFDHRHEDGLRSDPMRTAETLRLLFDLVNHVDLGLVYDPCNFYSAGEEAWPQPWLLLSSYVRVLHIKDARRYVASIDHDSPASTKYMVDAHSAALRPTPVGSGALPWDGILRTLMDQGFEGEFTLDPFVSSEDLLRWCDLSLDYLRQGYGT